MSLSKFCLKKVLEQKKGSFFYCECVCLYFDGFENVNKRLEFKVLHTTYLQFNILCQFIEGLASKHIFSSYFQAKMHDFEVFE